MRGSCAFVVIGFGAIVIISLIRAESFAAPPSFVSITLLVLAAAAAFGAGGRRVERWLRDRRREAIAQRAGIDPNSARRLMGDYSPYVIEAAAEIGEARNPGAVPVLVSEIERLTVERPVGWLDMAAAMVEALGNIGDPSCLPALHKLRVAAGGSTMANSELPSRLEEIIQAFELRITSLERASKLLRPSIAEECDLLRPSLEQSSDPDTLMRSEYRP